MIFLSEGENTTTKTDFQPPPMNRVQLLKAQLCALAMGKKRLQ